MRHDGEGEGGLKESLADRSFRGEGRTMGHCFMTDWRV